MRLLHIIASMDPVKGGPCQSIRSSIPELERLGVHNDVACLDNPDALFLKTDPFIIHAFGPSKTPWCYSARLMPWLLENLCRFNAVIIHGLWLYHGYAVRKSIRTLVRKKALKKPVISIPKIFIVPHGMLDPYFQRASDRKLKAIRNWIYWKLIESKVVNGAAGLLFTCKEELELARVPFRPYVPRQELDVGCGVADPPVYHPRMRDAFQGRCPETGGGPYILFLGRIHEKKGIDLLVRSYMNILSEITKVKGAAQGLHALKSTDCSCSCTRIPKLVIAGPGMETTYGQRVLHLAHRNKLHEQFILFPGMLSGETKWGAYYGCEAFILPSHQENFGIAVVEALACSKPVLISNRINIWKEIQDDGAGIISGDTLMDVQGMLNNWCHMANVQKLAMGRRARACYEKKFSVKAVAGRLVEAIEG